MSRATRYIKKFPVKQSEQSESIPVNPLEHIEKHLRDLPGVFLAEERVQQSLLDLIARAKRDRERKSQRKKLEQVDSSLK